MELQRLDTYQKIQNALSSARVPVMFFTQPQVLHAFLNKAEIELYSIEDQDKTYLFIHKLRLNELRLLFKVFPDDLILKLKEKFDPQFIAYNLLANDPHKEDQLEDIEVVVDVSKFINLEDKRIRKHYKQAVKHNTELTFKPFKNIPINDLEEFWKKWAIQRAEVSEKFSDRTSNDRRFLELFDDTDYFGVVAYDGATLVAYSVGIHYNKTYCLSAFNKTLRGYINLGLQISYEKAKIAKELGYSQINVGSINNNFKKHFLSISEQILTYDFELLRKESFKTFNTKRFLSAFWV